MKNLTQAILKVMESVKNIDKNLTVGDGRNSYKGVSDKDVKFVIGQEMQKNGLIIIPISIEPKVTIERWEETYNGQAKVKQSIFTEVKTKYLIMHSSGESMEIQGYGHGVDSQDKSAGKATTYALKYALLYLFMTPTGSIDDADKTHSEAVPAPAIKKQTKPTIDEETFNKAMLCNSVTPLQQTLDYYEMQPEQKSAIEQRIINLTNPK